jgi:hypothetical protein
MLLLTSGLVIEAVACLDSFEFRPDFGNVDRFFILVTLEDQNTFSEKLNSKADCTLRKSPKKINLELSTSLHCHGTHHAQSHHIED